MHVCKILGEHRDHSQHQEPLPGRAGINISVTVLLTEPPGEFGGIFSFIVSLRSTKECREENQELCAGTEVEGKAKSSEQVSREVLLPAAGSELRQESGLWDKPPAETQPLAAITCPGFSL